MLHNYEVDADVEDKVNFFFRFEIFLQFDVTYVTGNVVSLTPPQESAALAPSTEIMQ